MVAGEALAGDLRRIGLGVVRIVQEMRRVGGRDVRPGVALTLPPVVRDELATEGASVVSRDVSPSRESAAAGTFDGNAETGDAAQDALPVVAPNRAERDGELGGRAALPVARVPSNALHRAMSFANLGAKLIVGSAIDSISNRWAGSGSAERPANEATTSVSSHFITSKNAERLANHLSRLRGAALKLSQVLSMQDENVLPPEVQAALERVRAGADVMPAAQLEGMMRSALGDEWRERFVTFDEQPLAAASIGQVHAASIHDDGGPGGQADVDDVVDVVVKVQYPGVAKSIDSDIDNLMRLVRVANLLPKGLYVENAVSVAKKELALECDYSYELEAQRRYRERVMADPVCSEEMRLRVPRVFDALSSQQILVTERVTGVHIDKVAALDQATRDSIGTRLLRLTLKELYEWRFMQSDPNWGNFLYDKETDVLSLIDFGAAKSFSADFVADYLEMVAACAEKDEAEIIKRSISLGFLTGDESEEMMRAHCQAGILVGQPFRTVGKHDFGGPSMTGEVTELGAVMLKHRLTPPPDESYSLHRKLSGTFLACIKLRARVDARQLFEEARERFYSSGRASNL